ncbi:MAG: TAT-variant-translocated molybdopterin oxidoreductase [Acidobacteria bacterium]|nr:TAT-variant-translocated molybdopterin oxidoreductase [Acidobacteriota bacterium]
MTTRNGQFDFASLRAKLSSSHGQPYWRSLEELSETEGFQEFLYREFPQQADQWVDPVGRRRFLHLMGASLALAGLTGCTKQPEEPIVPYVKAPEEIIPGKPLFFATAMPLSGITEGLLVENHMGRPTKVEGNPEHPASLGATSVLAQASILTLYDPDRSQTVTQFAEIRSWSGFLSDMREAMQRFKANKGAGLRLLTETVTSPTLHGQLRQLLAELPAAKWHQYEPAGYDTVRQGAQLAFGTDATTRYNLEKANVVVSLDADFLCAGPGRLRYTRDFTERRKVRPGRHEMNRLYVVESTPSNTGAMADHRLPLRAAEVEAFALALAAELGVSWPLPAPSNTTGSAWIGPVARDLKRHPGASLVIAGEQQSPLVHALAHAMNHTLGNVEKTVMYTEPVEVSPVEQNESLRELVSDMQVGAVEMLLVLGGNPVFTAPADLAFAEALEKVKQRVHLGLYQDETSALCHWHIPEAHFLESWSDARAYDGTVTILQPLIAPLYGGKTAHEVLASLTSRPEHSSYEIVREHWQAGFAGAAAPASKPPTPQALPAFEQFWRKSLHDGVVPGTALPPKAVTLVARPTVTPQGGRKTGLDVVFRLDPHIHDGQFANNGWLQELPKPHTRLTWDNAALVSPATAERLGLSNEELVELQYEGRKVEAPVWIVPGQPNDSVALHLGYGRVRTGRVGKGAGFNAYAIRTSGAPWFGSGLQVNKTGRRHKLACTQHHHSMEGRNPVRAGSLEEYHKHPEFVHEMGEAAPQHLSMYPERKYEGNAWGMVIDLSACTGCNACSIACQSENNIAVVGKEQVIIGREMHWIRVDRYYSGGLDNPATYHQPVPCMQCENAPCEVVCPVNATSHSDEGLNDMVYNRCVGTRYCLNNCPYKVRRFNFLLYSDFETPSLKLGRNPDVTVRSRGVMEKCTYCVQRINAVKIEAEKEDRPVRDGEIVTACEAVCPAKAITFGNINDAASRVSKLKADPLNYGLLAEINTRPRTTYLAALRNPNPEIKAS